MSSIQGIFETHVQVTNLEKAKSFYGESLELKQVLELPERRVVFYELNDTQIFGIWEVEKGEWHHSHFAFHVSLPFMTRATSWLKERNIKPLESFGLQPKEPLVHTWLPMVSIYFKDSDGNTLEFGARLPHPPLEKPGVIYWSDWERLHQAQEN
ncbi:VOC family protein [Evansella tamaricis]|uniref:VOC family protein n=1 Tax=Evansella tamaricis TaxID=2069301 RepID=A0ABS6JJU6_9BACI|nr:VOC family protein [Evansella tamaricis]MBU9713931.1 VOC family protein [Evansella tamaricis]